MLTENRGMFTERVETVKQQMQECLNNWWTLSVMQQTNLYNNTRYILRTINRRLPSASSIQQAGTLPFMQLQGKSHYCGLCALNNLLGSETITVQEIDYIADDLWLRLIEQYGQSITDEIQSRSDSSGFHSNDALMEVANTIGYCLETITRSIQLLCTSDIRAGSSQILLHELLRCYEEPVRVLVGDTGIAHYTAIQVFPHIMWYFDSLSKSKPVSITPDDMLDLLVAFKDTTYSLTTKKQTCLRWRKSKNLYGI